jgi:phosphoglycolate phosphatase-like HAD superfamily hydrolase
MTSFQEGRENLRLLPGTRDILQWLGDEGVPCALLTRNDHEAVEHFVDNLALYVRHRLSPGGICGKVGYHCRAEG